MIDVSFGYQVEIISKGRRHIICKLHMSAKPGEDTLGIWPDMIFLLNEIHISC